MPMSPLVARIEANYRYIVVLASLGMMLIGTGSIFLLIVTLKPIAQDFGWPRSVPSFGYSLQYLGAGIGSIAMGHWFDRSGMGKPAVLGAVMIGSGLLVVSAMVNEWQFYIAYGVLIGLLGHATLYAPLMANIIRLFEVRRGMTAGVVASGQSIAGAVWPPIFRYFNDAVGWRETYFWFGIFVLATMLPLALVFWHRSASATAPKISTSRATSGTVRPAAASAPEIDIGVSPLMLMTALCVAIVGCCISMALPLAQLVSHATDLGYSYARGAEMLALALLLSSVCRLGIIGPVADRMGGLKAMFVFSVLQTVTVGAFAFVDGIVTLYLVAALFGIGYGGILPVYPIVVREYLPVEGLGRCTATVILFGGIGMAIGGWFGGWVYDVTGDYAPAFIVGAAANAVNLAIIWALIRRTGRPAAGAVAAAAE